MNNERQKEMWIIYLRQKNLSECTILNYQKHMKSFDKWLGGRPYVDVGLSEFQEFFGSLRIAASSKNVRIAVLSAFYKFLFDRSYIVQDVRCHLPRFDKSRKILKNVPTIKQVRQLILTPDLDSSQGFRDRCMILTQYSGGLRCAELLSMDLESIDWIRQTITITRKGGAVQTLPIGELAFEYLQTYVDEIRPKMKVKGDHLWVNDWGKRMTEINYRSRVKRYWCENGIEGFSTHSLRHGCGSHMLQKGAPLHAISAFLGHRDISSTEIYTKVNPKEIRNVIDDLNF